MKWKASDNCKQSGFCKFEGLPSRHGRLFACTVGLQPGMGLLLINHFKGIIWLQLRRVEYNQTVGKNNKKLMSLNLVWKETAPNSHWLGAHWFSPDAFTTVKNQPGVWYPQHKWPEKLNFPEFLLVQKWGNMSGKGLFFIGFSSTEQRSVCQDVTFLLKLKEWFPANLLSYLLDIQSGK